MLMAHSWCWGAGSAGESARLGSFIVQFFWVWYNHPCLHVTAGKCVMHLTLCSASSSDAQTYSVPGNLHVSISNLLILWALPGSRQTPYLRQGTMQAQRWLLQLYTWLSFCLNYLGSTICWQWQQVICPGLCKLFDSWCGEALCIERHLKVFTGIWSYAEPQ